jgi:quercetin dioxygenase-like cupin family protein
MNKNMKVVKKHWGEELWIADGTSTPYAGKKILFLAGHRTSLQVHQHKIETSYVLNGTGILRRSKQVFDISTFLEKGMPANEVEEYEKTFDVILLSPGIVFHIFPGYVHRVIANSNTDLEFIEMSSPELDDVFRLQDDQGRTHGRIRYEHE